MTAPARRAAAAAGVVLAALYASTAAPDVTFWDAGEFLTSFATFGIPHPPGTPLFVALGRVWTLAAVALGAAPAAAGNLLSVACTAAAGACTAWLVTRWTRSGVAGLAAALCAGTMSTVWSNATEAEVYAAALALACAALAAADAAGARASAGPSSVASARATAATAYALALAVPLHLSALVVAPAALWLACSAVATAQGTARESGRVFDRSRALALLSSAVLAAGVGTSRAGVVALGAAGFAVASARRPRLEALAVAGATALGLSGLAILALRAAQDPWLNQGDPSTWARLVDVVGRRQYAVAGLLPRQAPWWLQLANVGQWADWQVALGVDPGAPASAARTACTAAFVALGVLGSAWHRRRDRRSWTAVLLLLGAGSVGVACYLNLKAGPSIGAGVLPERAPHEARERDYFFVLAWWAWGIWAGCGAVVATRAVAARVAQRTGQGRARGLRASSSLGVCVAALPALLNWRVSDRRDARVAPAAAAYARALLENAPRNAVLFVNADNDTYPLWDAQGARGVRRDVTVVTVSLLPAAWYRAELARRAGLLPIGGAAWVGTGPSVTAIAARAALRGRPIAASLGTDDDVRHAIVRGAPAPGEWRLRGFTIGWVPTSTVQIVPGQDRGTVPLGPTIADAAGVAVGDRAALAVSEARAPRVPVAWLHDEAGDGVVAWAYRQLACPAAALGGASRSLEGACRAR